MSYIENDKIKVANLKNRTADYLYDKTDKLQVFLDFFERNKEIILATTSAITILILLFLIIFNLKSYRVKRYLGKMIKIEEEKKKNPLASNEEYISKNNNYRLSDFYIASAYKCYLPCTYYYDYSSVDAIIRCISAGARYLHFDIFPDNGLWDGGLRPNADPVVCNGDEIGNWHLTTSIKFDEVCKIINIYALGNPAPNSQNVIENVDLYNTIMNADDPLFIHLSLKCWGQTAVIDKCADILLEYFGHNLLAYSSNENFKYAFCGTQSNTNIALTPINELRGSIIIICDAEDANDIKNSKLFEVANISPNFGGVCRMSTYEMIRDVQDQKELIDYNKQNLTIVRPTEYGRDKSNYNFYTPWYMGCQFLALNYTLNDQFINNYVQLDNRFGKFSFQLKPEALRYKPITIKVPEEQNPNVTFQTQDLQLPNGNARV
jgi:hypothetical protein